MKARPRHVPLTWWEHRRYDRLLEATDHVAPYITFTGGRFDDIRFLDALEVVRQYGRGNQLLAVAGGALRRLAPDAHARYLRRHGWTRSGKR